MIDVLAPVFVASLLGSPHCAGMCGPVVCLYASERGPRHRLAHVAYNGGRLVSYLSLGVVAGLAGAGLDRAGTLAGIPRVATLVAGVLMVLWGAVTLAAALGHRSPALAVPGSLRRALSATVQRLQTHPPLVRALGLGLVTTLLPCGWLYAFVALAAGTGSVLTGALVMAVFWLGTLPMLTALGLVAGRALGPFRRRLPMVSAAVLVLLGLWTLAGRVRLHAPDLTPATAHVRH